MPTYLPLWTAEKRYRATIYYRGEIVATYTSGSLTTVENSAKADVKAGGDGYTYEIL